MVQHAAAMQVSTDMINQPAVCSLVTMNNVSLVQVGAAAMQVSMDTVCKPVIMLVCFELQGLLKCGRALAIAACHCP